MNDEGAKYVCQLKGTHLKNAESGTCISSLIAKEPSEKLTSVGTFVVHWCKQGSDASLVTTTTFGLPEMHVSKTPLLLDMVVPSHGRVRTPLPVSYVVRNNTTTLLTVTLAMEPSDAFMFAGHKQLQFRILPESTHQLDYNLYPLLCGLVALPQIKLSSTDNQATAIIINELIERVLPTHVYIMPQAKGKPQEQPIAVEN